MKALHEIVGTVLALATLETIPGTVTRFWMMVD
jgi:hypothetical protein